MLSHSNDKKDNKLKRGARIKVTNQSSRDEITSDKKNETKKRKHKVLVDIPVNIRTDNHIRNYMSALVKLGQGSSNKNLLELMVNEKINKLNDDDKKRFDAIVEILERKDVLSKESRK